MAMIRARGASPSTPDIHASRDPLALQKSTQYRLFPTLSRPQTVHKFITRRRKLEEFLPDALDPSCCSTPAFLQHERPPTVTVEEHELDDYYFNGDDHDQEDDGESWDVKVYRAVCRRLGVIPSLSFIRRLPTEQIILKYQNLTPDDIKACAVALVNNVSITHLDLEGNILGPSGARRIAEMLEENIYITHVSLAENAIGREGLRHMCALLSDNYHIQSMDLSGNGLRDEDAVLVANMLQTNHGLRELRLRHNEFRERGGKLIGHALAGNEALQILDLSWNHLRGEGIVAVCQSLQDNVCLREMDISWNGLFLDGSRALGAGLAQNTTLEKLDVTCNRISLECLKPFIIGLRQNKNLRVLKIGRNYLSNEGVELILNGIQDHPTLNDLDLGHQCMDDRSMELIAVIRHSRVFRIRHGPVLREDGGMNILEDQRRSFVNDDPMMVVMEFMRIRNLRLVDLFHSLDKDGSKSLDKEEFRKGLLGSNIPMHVDALDELIDKLDTNNDGEVDFSELMAGHKLHRRKLSRMKERMKERDIPFARTELGQINSKLRALMAFRGGTQDQPEELTSTVSMETNVDVPDEEEAELDEFFRKKNATVGMQRSQTV